MQPPKTPPNESARLARLEELKVLDTPVERAFDNITQLASSMLKTPIALISLVDKERQWFKSHHGLPVRQTPRDVSFCGHVVANGEMLVVPDANVDPRFHDNPLVTGEPVVRFYAGAPLRTQEGLVLGTLCAIDHVPRELGAQQREVLQLLAEQATTMLESRRAARRVIERESTLRALYEGMAEGAALQSESGAIIEANERARELLGLTEDELLGRTSLDPRWRSVHDDGSPFPGSEHPAMVCLRTGQSQNNVVMGIHKPSGELTWLSINARPRMEAGRTAPTGVVVTFRDITEHRAAAQHRQRHDRLVTTGTLAAGVGHEINNPLSFVAANVDFALEELRAIGGGSPSSRIRDLIDCLGDAKGGAERIRRIVRGLRSLARDEAEPTATSVSDVVDAAVSISMHELRPKATVVREIPTGLFVLADEPRLTQVFVNLLINAAQAFVALDPDNNVIRVTALPEGLGRVRIAIQDNGPGIRPEVLPRIFDPFFTTKPVGVGTGLGLSISHTIVSTLGGELSCETELGKGTQFVVRLPQSNAVSEELAFNTPPPLVPHGRVLVIDDEEPALRAMSRLLRGAHEVFGFGDPREAVARVEAGERFDVIFCDLMMPHLTGADVYRRVRAVAPKQAERMVFVTGGAMREDLIRFMEEVPNERLEKPLNAQNLKALARRFLSSK